MASILASYQEVQRSDPRCWTHPLVLLPAVSLFCIACGSIIQVAGCGALCTSCGVILHLVACGVLALLSVTWLLGYTPKKSEVPCPEEAAPYYADVLCLSAGGEILMSHAPGRRTRQSHRSLSSDVSRVKHHYDVDVVVTLLSLTELESMSCESMGACVEAEGMVWMYLNLRDKWVPWNSQAYLSELVLPLTGYLRSGSRVLIHCNGGKGRTGMLVAALLMTSAGGRQTLRGAISSMRRVRAGMLRNPLQQLFLLLHLYSSLRKL